MRRVALSICTGLAVVAVGLAGPGSARGQDAPVYHRYVGNLHSHTSYSDGVGTPAQAFQYARDTAGIDFLAVTDHNVALSQAEYADIRAQAGAFTQNGVFVAIAGQEWTGEETDHCTLLEADHVLVAGACDYDALYQEVLESGCTGAFAHPQEGMFDNWAYSAAGDVGVNSVEVRFLEEQARYAEILNNGWRVGADGSQDNHVANWGNGMTWTVALACSLTRAGILDACRNFRTYSTYDRDLAIAFESAGHMMGDAFGDSGNLDFSIDCHHRGGADSILRIDLYENGLPVAWLETRTDSCRWCPEITPRGGENNYFVRVDQEGYKRSFTSPMWVTCSTPLPSTPALCAPALGGTVTTLSPDFAWHPSDKAETYILEYSTTPTFDPGPPTTTVAGITDTCFALGRNLADERYYYWRVRAVNASGEGLSSGVGMFRVSVGLFLPESEERLTSSPAEDLQGALLQTSGDLWLAWCTNRDGNYEIYSKKSSDGGASWSDDECVSQDSHKDTAPALAETVDGDVWLVWNSRRPVGGNDVYYAIFDGASWSGTVRLTDDPAADAGPTVAQTPDGVMWVAWSSDREDGNAEIYCQTFDGADWAVVERLTFSDSADVQPALLSLGGGVLWMVWASDRRGRFEIYYKVFDGASWSGDMLLAETTTDAESPAIARTGDGDVWLAYSKSSGVFYRMLVAGQWSDEAMLRTGFAGDCDPSLAQTGDGRAWLSYTSDRDGNPDVYARQTNGAVTAAVPPGGAPGGEDVPRPGIALWPGRPNPFSSQTVFRYQVAVTRAVDLAIYDVQGRRMLTLAEGLLEAGEHLSSWDGRDERGARVPSGVYFCRLSAADRSLTRKVVLVR